MQSDRIYINRTRPYVTYALIGINVAVFLVEQILRLMGMGTSTMLLTLVLVDLATAIKFSPASALPKRLT